MRRNLLILGSVLLTALLLFVAVFFREGTPSSPVETGPLVTKYLRFSYTLTNQSSDFIENAEFITHIPAEIAHTQIVESIVASHDYQIIEEGGIHRSIRFNVNNLPPFGSRVINVTFRVQTSTVPLRDQPNRDVYLKDEKYIERDSSAISNLSQNLGRQPDFPQAVYQWLGNNIEDVGYVVESKGAKFAVEQRKGDCTEHMYAFIALARAQGIPARGVAGFVVEGSAEIAKSSSYHNWAEFYDGEKWILVDPQRQVFDRNYENYIAYRLIGGDQEGPVSTSRFLAIDERIAIKL